MKVLLVGSGAREHALADAIIAGNNQLFAFMSGNNPGINRQCSDFAIGKITDPLSVRQFAERVRPQLAVIGPEASLEAGVVDSLLSIGIDCFGPKRELAQLESSKSFTRSLLERHKINASPKFMVFGRSSEVTEIKGFINSVSGFVIKPDGLTGGKGVKVSGEHLKSVNEAIQYCHEVLSDHHSLVIEEKLDGEEFSLMSISDGKTVVDCPAVQDHKRAFENDTGPNTGGMGSYSLADHSLPFLGKDDIEAAHEINVRVARALRQDYGNYKGVLYGGFMATKHGVKLLEYNARFGDPEAMNVLPLLEGNFAELCMAVSHGDLAMQRPEFKAKATVCKYVVPKGYPDNPVSGKIEVPEGLNALRYFASVDEKEDGIYTTKSRAVAFVGIDDSIESAERIAEEAASSVQGEVYHRKDIGTNELIQKRIDNMRRIR